MIKWIFFSEGPKKSSKTKTKNQIEFSPTVRFGFSTKNIDFDFIILQIEYFDYDSQFLSKSHPIEFVTFYNGICTK